MVVLLYPIWGLLRPIARALPRAFMRTTVGRQPFFKSTTPRGSGRQYFRLPVTSTVISCRSQICEVFQCVSAMCTGGCLKSRPTRVIHPCTFEKSCSRALQGSNNRRVLSESLCEAQKYDDEMWLGVLSQCSRFERKASASKTTEFPALKHFLSAKMY